MSDDKIPPQDLFAEKCALGCMVISNTAADDLRDILTSKDFYSDVHAIIFRAILKLRDQDITIDAATLADHLKSTGEEEDIGGPAYLMELMDAVPYSEHAKYYAKIVLKMARRRRAIEVGRRLMDSAADLTKDETEVTEAAMKASAELADASVVSSKISVLSMVVSELIDGYEHGTQPAIKILIPDVDEITAGVCPGEMVVIGARPSHGKTLFALQSLDCASTHGLASLIVSEEMMASSLAVRMLQRITESKSDEWMQETDRLRSDAMKHFTDRAPILVAEKCGTVAAAERAIASAVRSYGIKVVAVDYAQLLKGTGDNEQERIGDVSQRMKAIATKYDLIMLLLAQLNRGIESRDNPEPQLSDLRGSGSLEQDADIALFPFWPWQLDKSQDPNEYRIYQRKNRNRGIRKSCLQMTISGKRQTLESAADTEAERAARSFDF